MLHFERRLEFERKPAARQHARPSTAKWGSSISPKQRSLVDTGRRSSDTPLTFKKFSIAAKPLSKPYGNDNSDTEPKCDVSVAAERRVRSRSARKKKAWSHPRSKDQDQPEEDSRAEHPQTERATDFIKWMNEPDGWTPCEACAPALMETGNVLDVMAACIDSEPKFFGTFLDRFQTEASFAMFDHPEVLKQMLPASLFVPFLQRHMAFVAEMANLPSFQDLMVKLFAGGSTELEDKNSPNNTWLPRESTISFLLGCCQHDPSLFTEVLCTQERLRHEQARASEKVRPSLIEAAILEFPRVLDNLFKIAPQLMVEAFSVNPKLIDRLLRPDYTAKVNGSEVLQEILKVAVTVHGIDEFSRLLLDVSPCALRGVVRASDPVAVLTKILEQDLPAKIPQRLSSTLGRYLESHLQADLQGDLIHHVFQSCEMPGEQLRTVLAGRIALGNSVCASIAHYLTNSQVADLVMVLCQAEGRDSACSEILARVLSAQLQKKKSGGKEGKLDDGAEKDDPLQGPAAPNSTKEKLRRIERVYAERRWKPALPTPCEQAISALFESMHNTDESSYALFLNKIISDAVKTQPQILAMVIQMRGGGSFMNRLVTLLLQQPYLLIELLEKSYTQRRQQQRNREQNKVPTLKRVFRRRASQEYIMRNSRIRPIAGETVAATQVVHSDDDSLSQELSSASPSEFSRVALKQACRVATEIATRAADVAELAAVVAAERVYDAETMEEADRLQEFFIRMFGNNALLDGLIGAMQTLQGAGIDVGTYRFKKLSDQAPGAMIRLEKYCLDTARSLFKGSPQQLIDILQDDAGLAKIVTEWVELNTGGATKKRRGRSRSPRKKRRKKSKSPNRTRAKSAKKRPTSGAARRFPVWRQFMGDVTMMLADKKKHRPMSLKHLRLLIFRLYATKMQLDETDRNDGECLTGMQEFVIEWLSCRYRTRALVKPRLAHLIESVSHHEQDEWVKLFSRFCCFSEAEQLPITVLTDLLKAFQRLIHESGMTSENVEHTKEIPDVGIDAAIRTVQKSGESLSIDVSAFAEQIHSIAETDASQGEQVLPVDEWLLLCARELLQVHTRDQQFFDSIFNKALKKTGKRNPNLKAYSKDPSTCFFVMDQTGTGDTRKVEAEFNLKDPALRVEQFVTYLQKQPALEHLSTRRLTSWYQQATIDGEMTKRRFFHFALKKLKICFVKYATVNALHQSGDIATPYTLPRAAFDSMTAGPVFVESEESSSAPATSIAESDDDGDDDGESEPEEHDIVDALHQVVTLASAVTTTSPLLTQDRDETSAASASNSVDFSAGQLLSCVVRRHFTFQDVHNSQKISHQQLAILLDGLCVNILPSELLSERDKSTTFDLPSILSVVDKNKTGAVHYYDLLLWWQNQGLRLCFREYDKNASGSIKPEQLFEMLRNLGVNCSSELAQQIFASIDVDGHGNVTYAEFQVWWETLDAHKTFSQYEPDEQGKVKVFMVESMLADLGLSLPYEHLHAVLIEFGFALEDAIDFSDFINLYKQLKRAKKHAFGSQVTSTSRRRHSEALDITQVDLDYLMSSAQQTQIWNQEHTQHISQQNQIKEILAHIAIDYDLGVEDLLRKYSAPPQGPKQVKLI